MKLVELIKSLTRAEKRFFKLYNSITGKESKATTKLFDLINKNKIEKEEQLKKHFLQASYRSIKGHLFENILASLALMKKNSSLKDRVIYELMKLEVMIDKGFYNEAIKRSNRLIISLNEEEDKVKYLSSINFIFNYQEQALIKSLIQQIPVSENLLNTHYQIKENLLLLLSINDYYTISTELNVILKKYKNSNEIEIKLNELRHKYPVFKQKTINVNPVLLERHILTISNCLILMDDHEAAFHNICDWFDRKIFLTEDNQHICDVYLNICIHTKRVQELNTFFQTNSEIFKEETNCFQYEQTLIRFIEAINITDFSQWSINNLLFIKETVLTNKHQFDNDNYYYIIFILSEFFFQIEHFETATDLGHLFLEEKLPILQRYRQYQYLLLFFSHLELDIPTLSSKYYNALKYHVTSNSEQNDLKVINIMKRIQRNWEDIGKRKKLYKQLCDIVKLPNRNISCIRGKVLERYLQKKMTINV